MKRAISPILCLYTFCAWATPPGADRASVLYSTQIQFDRENVPVVTVGLIDDRPKVSISAAGRIKFLVDGVGGPELITEAGRKWTATVENAKRARTLWHVRLVAAHVNQLLTIQRARRVWKKRGILTRPLTLGSVVGFRGRTLNSQRTALITKKAYESRVAAEAAATKFALRYRTETGVLPIEVKRARGTIVLSDGLMTIRAQNVVWLAPINKTDTVTVHNVEYGKGFTWHNHQDRSYRGVLYITVGRTGRLAIANMLSAEELLRGLVPAEIPATSPPAALRAQGVTARSELLAKIGHRHLADPYLVCGDVHCQVYGGVKRERTSTDAAVQSTFGQVLLANGGVVDTVYSANCGGHTEHNDLVWSGPASPQLRGKPDGIVSAGSQTESDIRKRLTSPSNAYCSRGPTANRNFRWETAISTTTIRGLVSKHQSDPGPIRQLTVLKRGVSGRVTSLRVAGTSKKIVIHGELVIRRMLGGLKSSFFIAEPLRSEDGEIHSYRFIGGGFGHGVGMCQDGSVGMAHRGYEFTRILKHYYPGTRLERVY
jgi:stage II sporulation protein D